MLILQSPPPPAAPAAPWSGHLSLAEHGKYRARDMGNTWNRSQGTQRTQDTDTGRKGTAGGAKPAHLCRETAPDRATGPQAPVFFCFSSSAPPSLSGDLVISLVIVGFPARGQTDQPHPFLLEADTKSCPKVVGIPGQDGGRGPAAMRCSGPRRDPRSVIIPWREFVRLQSGATDQMRGPN